MNHNECMILNDEPFSPASQRRNCTRPVASFPPPKMLFKPSSRFILENIVRCGENEPLGALRSVPPAQDGGSLSPRMSRKIYRHGKD